MSGRVTAAAAVVAVAGGEREDGRAGPRGTGDCGE